MEPPTSRLRAPGRRLPNPRRQQRPGTIHDWLASTELRNYGGYSNPRLDLILSNGVKATSMRARATLYHVAQQIIAGDRPIIYLYNRLGFRATSANLAGARLINGGQGTKIVNAQLR